MLRSDKIIGVGESGLDFYYNHSDKKIQQECFIKHIRACQETSKTLIYSYEKNSEFKSKAKELMEINREKFTLNKMTDKLDKIITPYNEKVPSQVGLQLPKLKKVSNSEAPK